MSDLAARWDKAKKDFEGITGKKKPDPKGKFAKFFHHTGVSGALKDADKAIDGMDKVHDPKDKQKAIAAAEKILPKVQKAATSYIKTLDDAVKDEVSDKGEKTAYSKGLKFLRERLDHLEKLFEQKIDAQKIAIDKELSGQQKAAKMVHKALSAACANAAAGVKKIKADPTPDRFNEIFAISDNPARKIQVQLVSAANAQKKGHLPELMIDPRFVADKFTPWQAGGKGEAKADPTWGPGDVTRKLDEFNKLLKLSARLLVDLQEKT
jgi:soluble cytochrome b562